MSEPLTITLNLNGVPVPVTLDDQALRAIAAALLERDPNDGIPWLSGARAASDYLGWPRERVYKNLPDLPHYKHEGRLMFRKDELDRYIDNHREGR